MRSITFFATAIAFLSAAAFGDYYEYSPEELAAIGRVKEECEKAGIIDIDELDDDWWVVNVSGKYTQSGFRFCVLDASHLIFVKSGNRHFQGFALTLNIAIIDLFPSCEHDRGVPQQTCQVDPDLPELFLLCLNKTGVIVFKMITSAQDGVLMTLGD